MEKFCIFAPKLKPIKIMRETKKPIPTSLLKKIRPLLATYGGRKHLSINAGIDYHQLRDIKSNGKALPSVIEKLKTVLV